MTMAAEFEEELSDKRRHSYPLYFLNDSFTDLKHHTQRGTRICAERGASHGIPEMDPLIDRKTHNCEANEQRLEDSLGRRLCERVLSPEHDQDFGRNSPTYLKGHEYENHKVTRTRRPTENCEDIHECNVHKEKSSFKSRVQGSLATWKRKSFPLGGNSNVKKRIDRTTDKTMTKSLLTVKHRTAEKGRKKSYSEDEALDTLSPLPLIGNQQGPGKLYKRSLSEPLMNISSMLMPGMSP